MSRRLGLAADDRHYISEAVRHVQMRQGTIGIKARRGIDLEFRLTFRGVYGEWRGCRVRCYVLQNSDRLLQ